MGCGGGLVGGLALVAGIFEISRCKLEFGKLFLFSLEIDRPMLIRIVVTFGRVDLEWKGRFLSKK